MSAQCSAASSTVATGGCSLRVDGIPSSASRAATAASCSVTTSGLDAGNQAPDPGNVDLLNRLRMQVRLREERRQIEIGLEAQVLANRRDQPFEPRAQSVAA